MKTVMIVAALGLSACSILIDRKEVARYPSPDKLVDAVLYRSNGGATTSFVYELFVARKGEAPDSDDPVLVFNHAEGFRIRWQEDKLLLAEFEHAKILDFRNFWWSRDVQEFRYVVEIGIRPTHAGFLLHEDDRNWDRSKGYEKFLKGQSSGASGGSRQDPTPD